MPAACDPLLRSPDPILTHTNLPPNVHNPPHFVPDERLISGFNLPACTNLDIVAHFLNSAARELKLKAESVAGGGVRVGILQDHYMFLAGAPLETYVLRIVGRTSGAVSQVSCLIPRLPNFLHSSPTL